MLKNYLVTAIRNLRRNLLFSAINVAGLAIGLTACFLLWQYVLFESGYDRFHTNRERLFRVPMEFVRNGVPVTASASNVAAVGHAMKAEFTEVSDYCRLVRTSLFTSDLGTYYANALEFSCQDAGGKLLAFNEEHVWFSDPSLLTMFSFPLIEGDASNALKEPNSIVITERIAKKYFGNSSALGKEMRLNREMVLKVTAVLKDIPANSHLQFDILISFATMRHRVGDMFENWGWSAFYNYVLLHPHADPAAVEQKFDDFIVKHRGPQQGEWKVKFHLQPITDIHLTSHMEGEQSANGNENTVYFLSLLAVFILVVAWINYINLSTAKALERSKEVGLRKSVGATRVQLIVQFLFDTALLNVIALLVALVLTLLSWPLFEALVGKNIAICTDKEDLETWLTAGLIFVAGVVISGVYPALTLSSFNPATVLKGKFYRSASGTWLRRLMVSFQYILALLLIAGTATIYLQLRHMRSMDKGFTTDQVLVVEAPAVYDSSAGKSIAAFENGLLSVPGVINVTATSDVPGKKIVENSPVARLNAKEDEFFETRIPSVDTSFFSTLDITLLAGRMFEDNETMDFRVKDPHESIPVVVNEEFIRRLGAGSNAAVLDTKLTFFWGPEQRYARIIGVVSNHHQVSFKEKVTPVMYMHPAWHASRYFAVRVQGDFPAIINKVAAYYGQAFPGHPFSHFFLDEFFDHQYRDDLQFANIVNVFTALAIVVTCLGLLGLSVFSVNQRTKEVGIRKVLGAPSHSILLLFSKDFMKMLLVSYLITIPVIYRASENWLESFSYRIPMQWQVFLAPPTILIVITMFTIIGVTLKASLETPVRALRQD